MTEKTVLRCHECRTLFENPSQTDHCPDECVPRDNIEVWTQREERLIPHDTVWKFVFSVSHAPHYVRQFPNGAFAGIYAPVEHVPGDNRVPFGLSEEDVLEKKDMDHVDVVEVPIEKSPWKGGAYL